MAITKITDHKEQAFARRLQQYKDKPNIEALIEAMNTEQIQDLEDVIFDLLTRLDISASVGNQLDLIGTIVGQERLGFDDDRYRILIQAKIGLNISNGEPERVISVFKLLTDANFIFYENLRNAQLLLGTDGTVDPSFLQFVFANMNRVVAGGVRINGFVFFDDVEPFSFAGINAAAPGEGFSSTGSPTTGGKFATLKRFLPPFAFDGAADDTGGFSSINDVVVGGAFIGL